MGPEEMQQRILDLEKEVKNLKKIRRFKVIILALLAGSVPLFAASIMNGNLGVGIASPSQRLEVDGNIRLGTSGAFWAPRSHDNVRIIRGRVLGDGTIERGSGYSVTKQGTGVYRINFSTSFASEPTSIATINWTSVDSHCNTAGVGAASQITIYCYAGGVPTDNEFSFIAMD